MVYVSEKVEVYDVSVNSIYSSNVDKKATNIGSPQFKQVAIPKCTYKLSLEMWNILSPERKVLNDG